MSARHHAKHHVAKKKHLRVKAKAHHLKKAKKTPVPKVKVPRLKRSHRGKSQRAIEERG